MSVKYEFLFVAFAILFAITMEVRIEGFTSPAKPDAEVPQNGSQAIDNVPHQNESQATDNMPHQNGSHVDDNVPDQNGSDVVEKDDLPPFNGPTRWRDIFTTPGYESWWLTTTRKPRRRVYFKDYPAGVGVPSWREVSPGTSLFSLHKVKPSIKPTAENISRGSYIASSFQIALNSFSVAFLLFCFCWP